jgi:pyruvate dehydrogenase E2 component (dihydrolipoamide acetyltransferase)
MTLAPDAITSAGRATLHRLGGADGLPDMLLIHGFGSDRYSWSATGPAFFDRYSVWAVELPGHTADPVDAGAGHASSMARAVAEAVSGKLTGPFPVVGHSLGGAVAVELANAFPELVSSLVLIAPAGLGPRTNDKFLAEFPKLTNEDEAQSLLEMLVSRPKLIGPQMVQHVLGFLQRPGRQGALQRIADGLSRLTPLQIPPSKKIAIVWGDADVINPVQVAALGPLAPHVTILEGVGHLPHVEQARKTNAVITEAILTP